MSFTMPLTTNWSEPRPSSRTPLFKSMLHHSSNIIFNNMMLNLERKRSRKLMVRKAKLRRKRNPSTFKQFLRRDKLQESLIPMLLSNSLLVDYWHVYHQDQD